VNVSFPTSPKTELFAVAEPVITAPGAKGRRTFSVPAPRGRNDAAHCRTLLEALFKVSIILYHTPALRQ
jgi:hypothetical protein